MISSYTVQNDGLFYFVLENKLITEVHHRIVFQSFSIERYNKKNCNGSVLNSYHPQGKVALGNHSIAFSLPTTREGNFSQVSVCEREYLHLKEGESAYEGGYLQLKEEGVSI